MKLRPVDVWIQHLEIRVNYALFMTTVFILSYETQGRVLRKANILLKFEYFLFFVFIKVSHSLLKLGVSPNHA